MEKELNIKIFVTHFNKPDYIYEDDVFVPIQAGKKNAKIDLGIQGDDTGDNISEKNSQYAELTTQYWVWKNYDLSDVDYVGFCHYRRYMTYCHDVSFKNIYRQGHDFGLIDKLSKYKEGNYISHFDGEIIKDVSDSIKSYVLNNQYDIYLTVRDIFINPLTKIFDYYLNIGYKNKIFYNYVKNVFFECYPDYEHSLKNIQYSLRYNHRNIFIMKKELFIQYSKWLFDYFFELDSRIKRDFIKVPEGWYDNRGCGIHGEIFINIRTKYQKLLGKKISYDSNILFIKT